MAGLFGVPTKPLTKLVKPLFFLVLLAVSRASSLYLCRELASAADLFSISSILLPVAARLSDSSMLESVKPVMCAGDVLECMRRGGGGDNDCPMSFAEIELS